MVEGTGTTTFTHNAASGNLISVATASDTTTYTWTGDNRLASASSSSTAAAFTYDAEGKRTSKTINGTTTRFVYDDIKLIAEKNASGTITARYFYDDSGKLISMNKGGNNYYFHLNQRGDVVKVTNASETVVASYSYDPWGNILSSTGSFKDEQPFRYASYFWDEEMGVYYVINRYYDPVVGRFLSKDPANDPESAGTTAEMNPYAYAGNNPVMATDPDGLNPQLKKGNKGPYVLTVKQILANVARAYHKQFEPNYANMFDMNTSFGGGLEKAVKAFQGIHLDGGSPLAVDGIVGDHTWNALNWWNNNPSGYNGWNDFYGPVPKAAPVAPSISEEPLRIQFPYSGSATAYLRTVLKVNGRYALFHYQDAEWFYDMVKQEGPWNLKRAAPEYGPHHRDEKFLRFRGSKISPRDFGNIHYGFVGRQLGLSLGVLKTGSFAAHFDDNGPRGLMQEFGAHSLITQGYNLPYRVAWVRGITYYTR